MINANINNPVILFGGVAINHPKYFNSVISFMERELNQSHNCMALVDK